MSFNVFNPSEAAANPFNFCVRLIKISFSYWIHNLRVPPPKKNSHRLAPVFAVLSVLGFIDDGRLQDLDRVPDAGGDDAAVIA